MKRFIDGVEHPYTHEDNQGTATKGHSNCSVSEPVPVAIDGMAKRLPGEIRHDEALDEFLAENCTNHH